MESRHLFEAQRPRSAPARRPGVPALVLAIVSSLLPGSGHFCLGERRLAVAILGLVLLAPPAALLLRSLAPEPFGHAAWLLGRLAVLSAIFAVWDAPARAFETARRTRDGDTGPRMAAWLNAMGFGAGHLRLGERGSGLVATLLGGGIFLAVVLFAPAPLRWMSEVLPLALALWGYRTADFVGTGRRVSTDLGELDRSGMVPPNPAARIAMPQWWIPATISAALVWTLLGGFAWHTQSLWRAAERVDTRAAIQMEPYYRNPTYGLAVEMHATGWTFRSPGDDAFLFAQHPGEATQVHLALRPRLPWWDDDERAAARELDVLAGDGFAVQVLDSGASTLAGRPAHRVRGRGLRGGDPREVELRMMAVGHRRYVLRVEWDPTHTDFAQAELRGLLGKLQIEGRTEDVSTLAR